MEEAWMASDFTSVSPMMFFWNTSWAPPLMSRVITTTSSSGREASRSFHVLYSPENRLTICSVERSSIILVTGFSGFTAIVRAPLTGIILLFEMSGSISQMLSLSIVSVTAYIVATLMRSEPIYDSLLKRILKADTIVHDK